jgi:hypothetical protein
MTTLICSIPEKLDARLEKLARQAKVLKGKICSQDVGECRPYAPIQSFGF